MGLIKAITGAIGGSFADQWLEVFEAYDMGETTVMSPAVKVRKNDTRNQNTKGTENVISNGSVIHVAQNQFMLLVDGGKVIDYTAEPGYYKVDNSSSPSLFNGDFGEALKETFSRIKFAGVTPYAQKAYFLNLQEVKNIAFGTVNPINYFDNFYNAELYLRAHGYFSIRIVEPLKFYAEVIPRNAEHVNIEDIHKLYLSEFLTAFQSSISRMSVEGMRISHVTSKAAELANYMSNVLDPEWKVRRGMIIESVGVSSITYDEESKKLINLRNQGAMLSDPTVREGYVQGSLARGLEAAGSNSAGSMTGFMGVGMGMNATGGFMQSASAANQAQINQKAQQPAEPKAAASQESKWKCACGKENAGNFCSSCGEKKPVVVSLTWKCACGEENTGNFCSKCGTKKPDNSGAKCSKCGYECKEPVKFCPECGNKLMV